MGDSISKIQVAVIPAAGVGRRAYPASRSLPKVLWEIDGRSLLVRNIELLRDQAGIRKFIVVVGDHRDQIQSVLQASDLNVEIEIVHCEDPQKGLAEGLLLVEKRVPEAFVTILGDELYLDSKHAEFLQYWRPDMAALCGFIPGAPPERIRKNYSLDLADHRVLNLVEKPDHPSNDLLGVGTLVFSSQIFSAIRQTPLSKRTGKVELIDALSALARSSEVYAAPIAGEYFNVNTIEDYHEASFCLRSKLHARSRVSVVIPARNEQDSIGSVVRDFLPHVHEVFVISNGSRDRTVEIAESLGARVAKVELAGYGDTIRYGLQRATGDILVVVEADHSFRAQDLGKFLEYLKDADMVIGTRTSRPLIEQGAGMRPLPRLVNIFVAKLIELLWPNRALRFTDVGCTYRAIWKTSYQKIEPQLRSVGPEFSPEMMIESLRSKQRIIEIPISYHPRLNGESKHSKNFLQLSRTALRMLSLIFQKRLALDYRFLYRYFMRSNSSVLLSEYQPSADRTP